MSKQIGSPQEALQERRELELKLITKAWEDEAFKQELLKNPQAAMERELGVSLKGIQCKVFEETPTKGYLVLARPPRKVQASEEELSDKSLEKVAGGAGVIFVYGGVILAYGGVKPPSGFFFVYEA